MTCFGLSVEERMQYRHDSGYIWAMLMFGGECVDVKVYVWGVVVEVKVASTPDKWSTGSLI